MGSQRVISVQTRLFLLIVLFTWALAAAFFGIQYTREREYKVELLNSRLQLVNNKIIEHINDKGSIDSAFIASLARPSDSLRVSLIGLNGAVLFDTNGLTRENHLGRKEVSDALKHGEGFTLRRLSSTNSREYFYSATRSNNLIVRSALPYNHSLYAMLQADPVSSYSIIAIALIMTIIAFFAAHRISRSVKNLRDFANKAEFGNLDDYDASYFPDDELGEISKHIVNLYKIQKETAAERDRSMREAIHEQRDKERIKNQLTNNISHELKTPVHIIQASLETIKNNSLPGPTQQKLINTAYDNAHRLGALLSDLQIITRINDAPEQIVRSEVNVTPIVKKVASEMSVYPAEQQMRIHIDLPDELIVNGNSSLIESIFRNLMVNSFNYSGGRDIFIKLEAETSRQYTLSFADNGVGVGSEHLPRIFERFYRIDTGRSREKGGTGLGLAIVKNAVAFHGGTIKAETPPDGGLKFTFTLNKE